MTDYALKSPARRLPVGDSGRTPSRRPAPVRGPIAQVKDALNDAPHVAALTQVSTLLHAHARRNDPHQSRPVQRVSRSGNKRWKEPELAGKWALILSLYDEAKRRLAALAHPVTKSVGEQALKVLDDKPVRIDQVDDVVQQLQTLIAQTGGGPAAAPRGAPAAAGPVANALPHAVPRPEWEEALKGGLRRQRALARGIDLADVGEESLEEQDDAFDPEWETVGVASGASIPAPQTGAAAGQQGVGPFAAWRETARRQVAATTLQSAVRAHLTRTHLFTRQAAAFEAEVMQWPYDFNKEARIRAIGDVGRQEMGPRFQWTSTPSLSHYRMILEHGRLAHVANLEQRESDKGAFIAKVQAIDTLPSLTALQKLGRLRAAEQYFRGWIRTFEIIKELATSLARHISHETLSGYTGLPAANVPNRVFNDLSAGRVRVGGRRGDYKSSHDKDEKNAVGISYELLNTPYVVHVHYKGAGTIPMALSIKTRANDPPGTTVVPDYQIGGSLFSLIRTQVEAAAENPRQIAQDRQIGVPAPHRRW